MSCGTYWMFWLIAPTAIAFLTEHPSALVLIALALVGQRWLPDPYLFLRYLARIRSLRAEIAANPGNATARRELASIYLAKRRPRLALPHLDAALARDPESAELHFLRGMARLGEGAWADAEEAFARALARDASIRYGEAHLRAGDALVGLGRLDEARAAYERFLRVNSSSIEGRYKLAAVLRRQGDVGAAKRVLEDASATYEQIPGFLRRQHWGWHARSRLRLLAS